MATAQSGFIMVPVAGDLGRETLELARNIAAARRRMRRALGAERKLYAQLQALRTRYLNVVKLRAEGEQEIYDLVAANERDFTKDRVDGTIDGRPKELQAVYDEAMEEASRLVRLNPDYFGHQKGVDRENKVIIVPAPEITLRSWLRQAVHNMRVYWGQ